MKHGILPAVLWLAVILPGPAPALECVSSVYRAGCAGPNDAASVNQQTDATRSATANGGPVKCSGVAYRAGCAGPNGGAAVIRR